MERRKTGPKLDKFAALKAARAGGSRLKQWKPDDDAVYDSVSEEQYKEIVGNRLERDDFIEDDDGSGYQDNGMDVWDNDRDSEEDQEEEERPKARRSKATSSKPSRSKAVPPPRPAAPAAYRPQISAGKEDDFMASLLSSVAASPLAASSRSRPSLLGARKRKSSPDYPTEPSSEGMEPPSSDGLYPFHGGDGRNAPISSDGPDFEDGGEGLWDYRSSISGANKKPRKLDALVKPEPNKSPVKRGVSFANDFPAADKENMDVDEPEVEEEDDFQVRSGANSKAGTAASSSKAKLLAMVGGNKVKTESSDAAAVRSRRAMVNSTSISGKAAAAAQALKEAEETAREVQAASLASMTEAKPVNGKATNGKSWMAIQESLNTGNGTQTQEFDDDDDLFNASVKLKAAKKGKAAAVAIGPLHRVDAFEPLDGDNKNTADVNSAEHEEQERTLRMYWLDYLEADNGVVHLVGKVFDRISGKYVSACVTVGGMQRNLFVLPRTKRNENGFETDLEVSQMDLHQEIDAFRRKHGVEGRFAMKKVMRKYAFELEDVPHGESEWYKVVYGYDQPQLPLDSCGATFSKIFGTNTSAFEMLVVKRKIMGPCWLEIKGCLKTGSKPASWCKLEVTTSTPKNVSPFAENDPNAPKEVPPLTVMSLAARTIVNHTQNNQELLAMTATVWENYNIDDPTPVEKLRHTPYTVVRPLGERFPPQFEARAKAERQIQSVPSERVLLNTILSIIQRSDPDVIVGHEFLGTNLEVFLQRMKELKADHWSRIGRFRRVSLKIGRMWYSNTKFLAGRLISDLSSDGAKGMIDSVTWSMTEMCQNQLGFVREEIDPDDTAGFFDGYAVSPDRLLHFMRHLQMDAFAQMAIASKVQFLPLTRQLTNLAGNSWNRTLTGARAERNEYILLHEFHRLKYICPDKGEGKASSRAPKVQQFDEDGTVIPQGKRAKYQGGLVFEPKRGLWDTYVLVMDFNSLYPSIIQEFNIDFTTVERHDDPDAVEDAVPDIPSNDVPQGVLPRLIATLVGRRRQVKSLMKDKSAGAVKLLQWDIKQKALKLTANSMYGCLGFAGSRFYARPLASLTTFKGREILTATKELAEGLSLDVVYGDTDSVFVNSNVTDYNEAIKIANEFKKHVNDRYRLLEIDLDAVFSRVLLLQKKKYAAVKVSENGTTTTEIKGLDMVRREYCKLSKTVSGYVLGRIMSGAATEDVVTEIHEYLTNINTDLRDGKIDLDDLIVYKRLGKNPEDYPDKKSQPHVQVALRMKAKGAVAKAGDVIPYIFCLGADGKSARTAQADKAFHPDEFRRVGSDLKIDFEYYLSQQVLPPIERLCEEIEGTDRARLAECLGLDPSRYQNVSVGAAAEKEFFTFESQISDKERFRDASPLVIRCRSCKSETMFTSIAEDREKLGLIQNEGVICTCGQRIPTASVSVQVENAIRSHIAHYYQGNLVCSDCNEKTRSMGVYGRRCVSKDRCRGEMKMEYPDQKLYNQLMYYASLFDVDKAVELGKGTARAEEINAIAMHNKAAFAEIHAMVHSYMNKCGRRYVDMGSLFSFMQKLNV